MGLDATVYCDCVERGRLRIPPPFPAPLTVSEDGTPDHTGGEAFDLAFEEWVARRPCPHDRFILMHHRLGNSHSVGLVRDAASRVSTDPAAEYPVLWSRVIYSGIHAGDWLDLQRVDVLRQELDLLQPPAWRLPDDDRWRLAEFTSKLQGLVYASLWVGKPISF